MKGLKIALVLVAVGLGALLLVNEGKRPRQINIPPRPTVNAKTPAVKVTPNPDNSTEGNVGDLIDIHAPYNPAFAFAHVWCDPEPCVGMFILRAWPPDADDYVEVYSAKDPTKKGGWWGGPRLSKYRLVAAEGAHGVAHFRIY